MPDVKVTVSQGIATVDANGAPYEMVANACVGANACVVLAAKSAMNDGVTQLEFEDILKEIFMHMYESTKKVFSGNEEDNDGEQDE